jgi:hypothetical protein
MIEFPFLFSAGFSEGAQGALDHANSVIRKIPPAKNTGIDKIGVEDDIRC